MMKTIAYLTLAACVLFCRSNPAAGAGVFPSDTVGKVARATVTVYVFDKAGKPVAQGSGFFFKEYRRLITNYHVLGKALAARVKTSDGRRFDVESIVAVDKQDDIVEALVDIPYGAAPYLAPSEAPPRQGEPLMVFGSPRGVSGVASRGKVVGIAEIPGLGKCIVHDARSSRGSSGSPVVNSAAEVIGVETAGLLDRPNIDFAIPVERFSGLTPCYRQLERLSALKTSSAPAATAR